MGGKQEDKGRQGRRALELQSSQEMPQGQRGDMQQDQTHPQLHRVYRQSSRLKRDGTCADWCKSRNTN